MPRRCAAALLAAAASAGVAVTVWAAVFRTDLGLAADVAAFNGFMRLQDTAAAPVAAVVAALCNPVPFALLSAGVVLQALAFRGPRSAVAAAVVLLGSNVITQYLKPALAESRMDGMLSAGAHVVPASWPSGHSTAAMAVALAAVMASPPAIRRLVAVLGGFFAVAVAYSVVLLGWHLPSDALGGFAVAGAVMGAVMTALWAAEARVPVGAGRRAAGRALHRARAPGAGAAAVVALVILAVVVLRVASWLPSPQHRLAFLGLAAAIAALPLVLAAVVARAQRT